MDPISADFLARFGDIDLQKIWRDLYLHYTAVTWAFLFDLLTDYSLYLISALGLYVLFFAGQVSLGHAGIVGVSAYVAGVVSVKLGLSFYLALPAAGLAGMLTGLLFWYLVGLRLTLFYLAIGTFAITEALQTLALNSDYLGAALGFHGIPLATKWYHVFIVLGLVMFAVWRLEQSRFGLAMRAIRDNPTVAGAMGINVARTKLLAWLFAGFCTGLAGCLHAHRVTILTPPEFSILMSINFVLAPLLGGLRTFWGTIIGGAIVWWLPWITTTDDPRWRLALYGVILVALMVFRPQGIFPATPTRTVGFRGDQATRALGRSSTAGTVDIKQS